MGSSKRSPVAMSPKRRFLSALFGGRLDRASVANPTSIATVELMERTGVRFPEAHLDGEKMAILAAAGHDLLGYDTIAPVFSVQQEAAALGCEVDWGDPENMPVNSTSPCAEPEEIAIPSDFLDRPSIRAVLQALTILRQHYGDRVAIVGKVMGPWTLSYHLNGIQQFLLDTIDNPDRVRRFLDVLKEVTVLFGKAQMRAGADVLVLADHATGDLVSPGCYRDFLLPVHQEINARLGCPTILHICGNTTNRLDYIAQAGFDAFHFDSKVDAATALRIADGRISLVGNVNNPETLLHGDPERVKAETRRLLEAGVRIVGPECAVPLVTPNRNLAAIAEAAEEYRLFS
ncbi:MAG: MtaA/CmuA family methyltransferase [Sphingomonadaceae bacterium]